MSWLRLIRWSNLLIIFLTQGLAWWCVILPLQDRHAVHLLLTPGNFLLLTASTVLIAAAGYIINDYFDIRIDAINKPEEVILEKTIPRRSAIIVHSALNAMALLLAGIVAWQGQHPEWLLLQAACIIMLWRYSTTWKRQFMIGNVVVALMTALTVISLILYEPALGMWQQFADPAPQHLPLALLALYTFAGFGFLLTWMREIVKDMEDYKGDAEEGCRTMPIRWGLRKSVWFVQALSGVVILSLLSIAYCLYFGRFRPSASLAIYILLFLLPALILWMIWLPRKATVRHYSACSSALKAIMVLGIAGLIIYHYQNG